MAYYSKNVKLPHLKFTQGTHVPSSHPKRASRACTWKGGSGVVQQWSGQKGHVSWIEKEAFPHTTTINYNHQMGMTWERAKFKVQCSFDWGPGIYKAFIVPLDRDCWRRIDKYDISFLNPPTWWRDLRLWHGIQYLCHRSKLNNPDC